MPFLHYRYFRKQTWILLLTFAVFLATLPAAAQDSPFDPLINRLIADGFDTGWIKTLFSHPKAAFSPRRVSGYFAHNESTLNYDQFLTKKSIEKAKAFLKKNNTLLSQAESTYQVPAELVTAIFLVESRLGTFTGNHRVFNILTTMAAVADPKPRQQVWSAVPAKKRLPMKKFTQKADRKSVWAYGELKALLTYAKKENLDPLAIKGSYAGAIGIPQFIPSKLLQLGVDGDQDGHVNLFTLPDAIPSAANYLKHFGWKPDIDTETAHKVLYAYNHSTYYVRTLLEAAKQIKTTE